MLTTNNMEDFFNKSISNGNYEGVPYRIYNKLIRMTTVLGFNDKFLIYSSDNRIDSLAILNICMLQKKEKGALHDFIWV